MMPDLRPSILSQKGDARPHQLFPDGIGPACGTVLQPCCDDWQDLAGGLALLERMRNWSSELGDRNGLGVGSRVGVPRLRGQAQEPGGRVPRGRDRFVCHGRVCHSVAQIVNLLCRRLAIGIRRRSVWQGWGRFASWDVRGVIPLKSGTPTLLRSGVGGLDGPGGEEHHSFLDSSYRSPARLSSLVFCLPISHHA